MENSENKILVIASNIEVKITINTLLSGLFAKTTTTLGATTGAQGIELASHEVPDVILLDTELPDIDGFEVCKQLKQNERLLDIPIVFIIDPKAKKESKIRGLEVGGDAFLSKPIDESELKAQIRAMIKIRKAHLVRHIERLRLSSLVNDRSSELELTHKATLNLLEDLKNEIEQRSKTEEQLRRSEARLERAELASKSGNWEVDIKKRIVHASTGACVVYGFEKKQIDFDQVAETTIPEYRELLNAKYKNLIERKEPFSFEYKIKKPNTGEIIDIYGIADYDEIDGRIFGVVQDITEQKRIREALAESEALYRTVLDSTPDIITTTDKEGKALMTSASALKAYGYSSMDEIEKIEILNFIHPDDYKRAKDDFSKMAQGIHTGPNEYKSIKKDGSVFNIEVKGGSIRDKEGHISKLVYIARDVTERKKAELKLIQSEAEFRSVWENSASGLRLADKEGNILRVNEAYCKIFNKTQSELKGATIAAVYPSELRTYKMDSHKQRFKKGVVESHIEKEVVLWNNEKKWVQVENSFLVAPGENPLLLGVFTDITQRKQSEERIKHLSRLYAFIGQVNQAIVRNTDPNTLMQKVCEVAVEYGGFRMAWIGKYEEQEDSIKVVTFAGNENGYLSELKSVLTNIKSGTGPTKTAVIKKQIACSHNMLTDNNLVTSKEKALQYGFKSFAVIPLLLRGNTYGTLNLYSGEINFFNQEELKLLTSIAEDLNFALNAIEAEKTRKIAEKALFESESRYNAFVNNSVDMIFVKDENRRYLMVNYAMANFFGKKPEEILDRTDSEIAEPDLILPCESSDLKALKSDSEIFNIEKLGDRYFEITKFKMPLKNGKWGIGGIMHDISKRRQSEQALEESRLELEAIYDNAPVMLCVLNEKLEIIFQNNEFTHFTQQIDSYSSEILIGNVINCIEAIEYGECGNGISCPDCTLRNAIKDSFTNNKGKKNFEHYVSVFINGQKKEIVLLGSTAVIQSAGQRKILLTLYDITSRKEAEEALQKSEMFLRTFIDNIPFQIWARDTQNIGILENKMLLESFGSIIGKKPSDNTSLPSKIVKIWEKENKEVQQGKLIDTEIEYVSQGKKLNYQQIIFPIHLNNKVVAIAGFSIDITERVNNQKALRESQEQLKSFAAHLQDVREEERVMLAREIHDDLGQILVAIKIDLGLLGMKATKHIKEDASDEFMTHFKRLAGQVDNTIKTARRIMSNLRPEMLDILGFVDAVGTYLNSFSERFNIKSELINKISDIEIDPSQSVALFRIIQESLNNVAKHASASKVTLSLYKSKNDKVCITIKDNGNGFDVNAKKRTDSYGLIGMKERAYLIDAELTIDSKLGKGTVVKLEIPTREVE